MASRILVRPDSPLWEPPGLEPQKIASTLWGRGTTPIKALAGVVQVAHEHAGNIAACATKDQDPVQADRMRGMDHPALERDLNPTRDPNESSGRSLHPRIQRERDCDKGW